MVGVFGAIFSEVLAGGAGCCVGGGAAFCGAGEFSAGAAAGGEVVCGAAILDCQPAAASTPIVARAHTIHLFERMCHLVFEIETFTLDSTDYCTSTV
jgi:hypothetical protein